MPGRSRINAFGMAGGTLIAGTDSGIFISRDGASSWQPGTGAAMTSGRVIALATVGQKVFAGTDGSGLLVSSDGGMSWSMERGFSPRKVRCLLAHGGTVYVGTEADGVFSSDHAGQSWAPLRPGLPANAQVFDLVVVKERLFAGLYSRGLYSWDDSQHSWTSRGAVSPLELASVDDTLISGENPGGLDWSGDFGMSWTEAVTGLHATDSVISLGKDDSNGLSSEAPVWALESDGRLVFAGASAGVYYSEDRGRTWTKARQGLPEHSPGIAFLVTPEIIVAGCHIRHAP